DFIVNGTFVPNQGTVVFNGSSTQSINRVAGSDAVTIPFFNVHVNKASATFRIESSIPNTTILVRNEFRILQNSSAPIDVDFDGPANSGVLVLGSVASRTARIPAIPTGVA